ncbi:hypothetical protein PoB_000781300 [Plakobranchus ocellatus]|uniref:Uncharacterized protein n=1 Tax=Plakobranchus ocellatus TaxID=259542 RepID=A0AAV3YGN9_9GAST|nr:hypothetical protein PoB_000781300 [Plakobranchus ocellatus]
MCGPPEAYTLLSPVSACSFTFFADVFSQVGEYFMELVSPHQQPNFLAKCFGWETLRGTPALCQGYPGAILPAQGVETSTGIDPSPIQKKLTSRLGSISGEGNGQRGMLMSNRHYCRAVTTSTPRIHPSPIWVAPYGKQGAHTVGLSIISGTSGLRWIEVVDSRRRSKQDNSTGKEVRREDKARWRESYVAHIPERASSWATPCFSRLS